MSRMRKDRIERVRQIVKKYKFDALLLYDPANIRYVTSTVAGVSGQGSRFCLLPGDNAPILWEIACDADRQRVSSPWLKGRVRYAIPLRFAPPEIAKKWALDLRQVLKEEGIKDGFVGVDAVSLKMLAALEAAGIRFVDAGPAMAEARMIKTQDEIACIRQSVALAEPCFDIAQRMMRPGVRERDIQAEMARFLHKFGAEGLAVVASGDHTRPYWRRNLNDRMLRPGELVVIDRIHTLNGYPCDYIRTFVVGDRATKRQRELHRVSYEYMYSAIELVKPGAMTAEIAEKFHEAEDYSEFTLQFGHGIGLSIQEPPYVSLMSKLESVPLQPNMALAFETYVGDDNEGVRCEENLIVTETGYEIMSRAPYDPKLSE